MAHLLVGIGRVGGGGGYMKRLGDIIGYLLCEGGEQICQNFVYIG